MSATGERCSCDEALAYRKVLKGTLRWLSETHVAYGDDDGAVMEARAIRKVLRAFTSKKSRRK